MRGRLPKEAAQEKCKSEQRPWGGPWEAEGAVWARPVPAPGTQCKADAGKAGVDMVLPSSPLFYIFKVSHFLYFHIRHPSSPYTKS